MPIAFSAHLVYGVSVSRFRAELHLVKEGATCKLKGASRVGLALGLAHEQE